MSSSKRQHILAVVDQPHAEPHRRIEVLARFIPALAARDRRLGDRPGEDDLEVAFDVFGLGFRALGGKARDCTLPGVLAVADDLDLGQQPTAELGHHRVPGLVKGGQALGGR